ncbi:MAG: branched-chain amino acid transaminase [Chloroflexi bacterium]|nr:branched-chain amino acid transaminase [Chloroflexota bacterium]MCI0773100.1 branched-chain amino acid transaminase [Chloroflexota bacterium]MCI0805395.1 branched-chain amino acid transaminase [Chloroflexota bacterium]MCI0827020.1 branched-chain amino acid transaminase [Chloroflexota bacterium]MCI0853798.1 branched-chain amino acid transaminase [Chloroflexota bacterium]
MDLPEYAYFRGEIVPYGEAKVGVLTHALNYGTAAFGGIRGYWNDEQEQLFLFRPIDHYERFLNSGRLLCSENTHTAEGLRDITLQLLRKEGLKEDCYIRPLLYKSDEIIGVRLHDLTDDISIVAVPFGKYVQSDTGAHVTFSSWRRVDDNAMPARGKISGAYVNTAFVKTDALRGGFDEALVLNNDGHLAEGSAENVFMMRNGVLNTPPITDNILEGITRRTVIELAQAELGLEVMERSIDRTEVYLCDELFLTGTAAQITAVTRVDFRDIGTGEMGPVTRQLREIYEKIVRGQDSKYTHWIEAVYESESVAVK